MAILRIDLSWKALITQPFIVRTTAKASVSSSMAKGKFNLTTLEVGSWGKGHSSKEVDNSAGVVAVLEP